MNTTEKLRNDIIIEMNNHLSKEQMQILDNTLIKLFRDITVTHNETLPATVDNTNDYIIKLFKARKAVRLSKNTVNAYLETIKELITYTDKPLLKITQMDVESYLNEKFRMGNTGCSVNNRCRNISAFFSWMQKMKLVTENPCLAIEPFPTEEKPIQVLEVLDIEKIRNSCTTVRQRAIVEILRCTALRRGEIPGIRISDIDFRTGAINIYAPKTRKRRVVFLDEVALFYLNKYLKKRNYKDPDEPLFVYRNGRPFNERDVYDCIHYIAKKIKMDKLHPHIFRSTCATNICRRGGSEEDAGNYLGHAPSKVTKRFYIRKSADDTLEIFNKYVKAI